MNSFDFYKSIPVGSLVLFPEKESAYLDYLVSLPANLTDLVTSSKTGAYIRGLAKAYNLTDGTAPSISFIVLEVIIGELPLTHLAAAFSSRLSLPNDKSNQIASELEHDLFAPVAGELSRYLETRKQDRAASAAASASQAGASNVLNLKDKQQPPTPPPIPRPLPRNPNSVLPRL